MNQSPINIFILKFGILTVFLVGCFFPSILFSQKVVGNVRLDKQLSEISGLAVVNGQLWGHNDSGGLPVLYQINPYSGNVIRKVWIANASNIDWEDLAQDSIYIYIGDIGNNLGLRKNIVIYQILINDLLTNDTVVPLVFTCQYAGKMSENGKQKSDLDAEALIVYSGKLLLINKSWNSKESIIYEFPLDTIVRDLIEIGRLNGKWLVTGGVVHGDRILLTGYNKRLKPVLLMVNTVSNELKKLRIRKMPRFAQIEAVTVFDGKLIIASETFCLPFYCKKARIYQVIVL